MNQPAQQQELPGRTGAMNPRPDHGEESYRGSGRLAGKASVPSDHVESFGSAAALDRPGQPAEVAPAYVMLASDEASYVSGARIAVTGGKPTL
jgi:NAD(P)-dependent dehydrogenase (short-subunit alcohol dehydrogenase family)